jgi:hypothetical protein
MIKIVKLFIASLLAVCLTVATVICCCIAPAVMTHFHKVAMCGHCQSQNSHGHSSNSTTACQYHLTSAEFLHTQAISSSAFSGVSFPSSILFDKHITIFLLSSVFAYPRGSPPWAANFTPLYLRTYNLRV